MPAVSFTGKGRARRIAARTLNEIFASVCRQVCGFAGDNLESGINQANTDIRSEIQPLQRWRIPGTSGGDLLNRSEVKRLVYLQKLGTERHSNSDTLSIESRTLDDQHELENFSPKRTREPPLAAKEVNRETNLSKEVNGSHGSVRAVSDEVGILLAFVPCAERSLLLSVTAVPRPSAATSACSLILVDPAADQWA